MNTDLIVRFIQNIRVHPCPSVVYKYTNLACSTLGVQQFRGNFRTMVENMVKFTFYIKPMSDPAKGSARQHIVDPIDKTNALCMGSDFVVVIPYFVWANTLFIYERMIVSYVL